MVARRRSTPKYDFVCFVGVITFISVGWLVGFTRLVLLPVFGRLSRDVQIYSIWTLLLSVSVAVTIVWRNR